MWSEVILELGAIFVALLLLGYVLPAGLFHWLVDERRHPAMADLRIQRRRASAADVRREVSHSLLSLALFSLYSTLLLQVVKSGSTALYWTIDAYPLTWLPLSFIVTICLHDTYFYWTHRLMHARMLFRYAHVAHHRSLTPTAWAILSFQPLETVLQFGFFALLILFFPIHPAVLVIYFVFDGLINAAGHCGYELVPPNFQRHWLLKYFNAVTHHDLHHSRFNYNFSQYFNVWDRLMGTFLDRSVGQTE